MPFVKSMPNHAGPPQVFKKYPAIYRLWSEMSQELMNGPSPLTPGERELIFAYAAGVAGCDFVYAAHAAVAYAWGYEEGLIDRLLAGLDDSPLEERWTPLLAYVGKLAVSPNDIVQADVDAVLDAGWDEDALHTAVAVTARMSFMQRLAQGYGFTPFAPEVAKKHAERRVELGYVNLYPHFAAKS